MALNPFQHGRCPACGTPFQTEEPDQPGYLPPPSRDREGAICQRCFKLVHYGKTTKPSLNDDALVRSLKPAMEAATGLILLVDPTTLEFSRRALELCRKLSLPFLTVITKTDLFQRWMTPRKLLSWVSKEWNLPRERVVALSLFDRKALSDLRPRLRNLFGSPFRLLVMGAANAGKSTFIQAMARNREALAISPLPGTTLDFIEISLSEGGVLIDSPGLSLGNFWIPRLCPQCLEKLVCRHKLTRKTFILHPGQSLMFGGLAYARVIDCGDRDWIKVTAFASVDVPLHRTKAGKEELLMDRHAGELLSVPCPSCYATLRGSYPFEERVFTAGKGEDLILPGCGWLSCYQGEASFSLVLPQGLVPSKRFWLVEPYPPKKPPRRR
ncbi:MAG: 50S ribosome-binding GTPase [Synergistaceae bacterium]|nr:50S ribosome-binding GTPase [Synergistaceae bacterium]